MKDNLTRLRRLARTWGVTETVEKALAAGMPKAPDPADDGPEVLIIRKWLQHLEDSLRWSSTEK